MAVDESLESLPDSSQDNGNDILDISGIEPLPDLDDEQEEFNVIPPEQEDIHVIPPEQDLSPIPPRQQRRDISLIEQEPQSRIEPLPEIDENENPLSEDGQAHQTSASQTSASQTRHPLAPLTNRDISAAFQSILVYPGAPKGKKKKENKDKLPRHLTGEETRRMQWEKREKKNKEEEEKQRKREERMENKRNKDIELGKKQERMAEKKRMGEEKKKEREQKKIKCVKVKAVAASLQNQLRPYQPEVQEGRQRKDSTKRMTTYVRNVEGNVFKAHCRASHCFIDLNFDVQQN